MSINFSSKDLFTRISSSCVCADNHDVENLISDHVTQRVKGFQGEVFVRTPVNIEVYLPTPIIIHKIDITPWIGRQCIKVIKIYAGNQSSQKKNNEGKLEKDGINPVFKQVGSALINQKQKLSFVNAGYKANTSGVWSEVSNGTVINLRGCLHNINILKVTVSCMLQGSIPSIGSLDVWGKLAQAAAYDPLRDHIISRYNEKVSRTCNQKQISIYNDDNRLTSTTEKEYTQAKEVKCPQEFLDPLTCEMMRAPVLLPCGHTVDRSTLDKHIQAQAELGNAPCDPFTGIPFTENSTPKPNVLLKMRMDNYNYRSLQNNVEVGVPNSVYSNKNPGKRPCHQEIQCCKRLKTVNVCPIDAENFTCQSNSASATSHQVILERSLNEALVKTLGVAREKRILTGTSEASNLYCAMCNAFLSSAIVQYQLPCQHILCEACMKNPQNYCSTCPTCLKTFEFKSVQRIYT